MATPFSRAMVTAPCEVGLLARAGWRRRAALDVVTGGVAFPAPDGASGCAGMARADVPAALTVAEPRRLLTGFP